MAKCRMYVSLTLDIYICVLLACFCRCVLGVTITHLRVPPEVQNGTGKAVILDCEYSLRSANLISATGLVVKWFFNGGPEPVYQWIPNQKPQDLGILRGRLNLDYRASSQAETMHRALYIVNPTTELSGEYKCFVSTFTDEDFMIKKMIVFSPEKSLEMTYRKTEFEGVNITCWAQGVYPEPKIMLFKELDEKGRIPLQGVAIETSSKAGYYNTAASIVLLDEDLDIPTIFYCELKIPDTSYIQRKKFVYYPGNMESLSSTSEGSILRWSWSVVCLLLSAVIC